MYTPGSVKSTNPFDDRNWMDIDDETFLQNSRRPPPTFQNTFDAHIQNFQDRRREIQESTLRSTERSLCLLRDTEQIGLATGEELMRQREKLENTDKQLDDINNTLRFSQKHINGIKSIFGSLKNYFYGRNKSPTTVEKPEPEPEPEPEEPDVDEIEKILMKEAPLPPPSPVLDMNAQLIQENLGPMPKKLEEKIDASLKEILKGLAGELGQEIDSQNELIDGITDKTDKAATTIQKQNKEMNKIMKK